MIGLFEKLSQRFPNNYLDELNCINRLMDEYKEHGNLLIALDFDNTIYDYHSSGMDLDSIVSLVSEAHLAGLEIFIFTANEDHGFVKAYVKRVLGIDNIQVNTNSMEGLFDSRKPFYSILLDDRAGLHASAWHLAGVLNLINNLPKA